MFSYSSIVNFLSGSLGKRIIAFVVASGLLGSILFQFYQVYVDSIKKQALIDWNQRQTEQVIKDQQDLIHKMDEIQKLQDTVFQSVKQLQDEKLDEKINTIKEYLKSVAAKKNNRPSSEVLKETIKRLSHE